MRFEKTIKIDHHPFVEKFCDIEYIEDTASSTAEIIMNFIMSTELQCDKNIAETLYLGLASDSNRFLFDSCTSLKKVIVKNGTTAQTFALSNCSELIRYSLNSQRTSFSRNGFFVVSLLGMTT